MTRCFGSTSMGRSGYNPSVSDCFVFSCVSAPRYAADFPSARLSIDAYVQMALQLAFYRIRGEFSATYETALTRSFDRGRTETIRSYTTESRAFVLGMQDPSVAVRLLTNLSSLIQHSIVESDRRQRRSSTCSPKPSGRTRP